MPSPFPGMDPYLEDPEVFPDFHNSYITYLREYLQARLPPPYYASSGQRSWIEVSQRRIEPDVSVFRPRSPAAARGEKAATAVISPEPEEPLVVRVPIEEHREPYLEVFRGRGEEKRLVASVEMLSPSNKRPGTEGRELYLRKQKELLRSPFHLIEIDLLRMGEHATAVPLDSLLQLNHEYDFHVCVHRFDQRGDYFIHPILLEDRLPIIPFPLLPGDGVVPLDLQTVFDRTYDTGPYPREIDYTAAPPPPPLEPELLEWVRERARTASGN